MEVRQPIPAQPLEGVGGSGGFDNLTTIPHSFPAPHRAPGERRLNRLVFIGRNLDREELNSSFRACLAVAPAAE